MKIVVGIDFSQDAKAAVRCVATLRFPAGSELYLVHVIRGIEEIQALVGAGDFERAIRTVRERLMERLRRRLSRIADACFRSDMTQHILLKEGNPREELLSVVEQEGADLVVCGSRGVTGLQRFLLGSVSERVLREAPCSVLIVRGQARRAKRTSSEGLRILLATDGSPDAQEAVRFLSQLGFPPKSEVTLFHVMEPKDYTVVQDDYRTLSLDAAAGIDWKRVSEEIRQRVEAARVSLLTETQHRLHGGFVTIEKMSVGYAAEEILRAADRFRPDLIVMGSRGHTGLTRTLLGSVSDRVARHAPCSVLVVRKAVKIQKVNV